MKHRQLVRAWMRVSDLAELRLQGGDAGGRSAADGKDILTVHYLTNANNWAIGLM